MALQSPGVEVTVIDESFYTPAEPGTTPLIVVATAQDKANAAGTGTAAGTTKANAGIAFRLTSQRDLVDLFGVPFFEQTASGAPVHGGERNEYGLLAAYSLLGVSNNAFIVRADVNLSELEGTTEAPGSAPDNNSWWVDTAATTYGIQEWNSAARDAGGQRFVAKTPLIFTDTDAENVTGGTSTEPQPRESVGSIGDYAIVFLTGNAFKEAALLYYKSAGNGDTVNAGQWVLVGSNDWAASHPAVKGGIAVTSSFTTTAPLYINNAAIVGGTYTLSSFAAQINSVSNGVYAQAVNNRLYIYTDLTTNDASSVGGVVNLEDGAGETWSTRFGIDQGLYLGPVLQQSPHTQVPEFKRTENVSSIEGVASGAVWIKTTEPNSGARWRVKKYNAATQLWEAIDAPMYSNNQSALYFLDRSGGGVNIPTSSVYVQYNSTEDTGYDSDPSTASFRVWKRQNSGSTTVSSRSITDSGSTAFTVGPNVFRMYQSVPGKQELVGPVSVSFTAVSGQAGDNARSVAAAINSANFGFDNTDPLNPVAYTNYVTATVTSDNRIQISHTTGGEIRLENVTASPLNVMFGSAFNIYTGEGTANLYAAPSGSGLDFVVSNWRPMAAEDNFFVQSDAPENKPADGRLWYNPSFGEVDMMVHNGTTWVGYQNQFPDTDPSGPIVSASEPDTQSDGSPLATGDLWISTADLENFPTIYRYDNDEKEWNLVDKTDQTTEDGVLFADARFGDTGADGDVAADIADLLTSNYLDPDAPDPDLYPRGMLLWNTRRSGGNVKRFVRNWLLDLGITDNPRFNNNENMFDDINPYALDRWVTVSANNEDGSGSFGRKAQRKVVVQALKSIVDSSEEIRDEERRNFNIIAAPGYPELLSNLVNLNIDRGLTAFVIGDTPLRLASDATTLVNYGTNAAGVVDNSDEGIVTFDEYSAVYYPNGFTTDLSGANAVVPASHMMMRTIALSDQVSYPWFAPAGTRRGGITNATSVGFIDAATGEFQTVSLNEGTRDVLYDLKINPIPFFVGVGLVAFGQKTRARNASALDRINVARLIVYLRSQLAKLARPYIFEPNDKITRDEVKGAVESLLLELVGLRAIYDFAVVCDETNNTPSRVDRNELWVDVAIEPVKAVEFIYIPLRVKNTGEI
jgi:hypothetical protein